MEDFMRLGVLFTVLWSVCFFPLSAKEFHVESLHGEERVAHLKEVSNFYNAFYREPPYFYDCAEEGWDRYIHSYVDQPESILCLAVQDETIIGIIIGTPLVKTTQKYNAAFRDRPADLESLFFLGELAVNPEYDQLEVKRQLYAEFERQVREREQFSGVCVWQLQSEEDKPSGFFWCEMGFANSGVYFEELWKDTFGTEKVPHSMLCWKKQL